MPIPVPSLPPFHTSEIFMPDQQEKCPQANQITISYMLYFELKFQHPSITLITAGQTPEKPSILHLQIKPICWFNINSEKTEF